MTSGSQAIGKARLDLVQGSGGSGVGGRVVGHASTRPDGSFSLRLRARGPSRSLRVRYGQDGSVLAVSSELRLGVRAASTLRASLRGTRIRYSGRVLTRPIPTHGKRVTLQGRAPGYAWATFATRRTDRRGRFAGTYRLPLRRPGVKLQIRVVVPTEKSYPYATYRVATRLRAGALSQASNGARISSSATLWTMRCRSTSDSGTMYHVALCESPSSRTGPSSSPATEISRGRG